MLPDEPLGAVPVEALGGVTDARKVNAGFVPKTENKPSVICLCTDRLRLLVWSVGSNAVAFKRCIGIVPFISV